MTSTARPSPTPTREVRTEADGSFGIEGLLPRAYEVEAYAGELHAGPVIARLSETSDPVVLRGRRGSTFEVVVIDENGRDAVAGAEVELSGIALRRTLTGVDGVARFVGVGAGWYQVDVTASGHGLATRRLRLVGASGAVERESIELAPGAPVTGTVTGPNGKPVAAVEVTARSMSRAMVGEQTWSTKTDAAGRWRLPGLAAGSYQFVASGGAFADARPVIESVDGATERGGIVLHLEAGARVAGRVVDRAGQPVGFPMLTFEGDDSFQVRHGDVDGRFAIEGLPRRSGTLWVRGERASASPLELDLETRPDREGLRIVLDLEGTILGVVVDGAGEPVADAQVTAQPAERGSVTDQVLIPTGALTDQAGRFELRGLPPGEFRLAARRPGAPRDLRYLDDTGTRVSTGARAVRLRLDELSAVVGKVVGPDGEPIGVFSIDRGVGSAVAAVKDADGRFRIDDLSPGWAMFAIDAPGFQVVQRRLEVAPGETADAGTIELVRGRVVRGRVVGVGGAPVPGAKVVVGQYLEGDGQGVSAGIFGGGRETRSDAAGRFEVAGLAADSLLIAAEHPTAGAARPTPVPAGEGGAVEVVLAATGALAGTVRQGGRPVGAIVTARFDGEERRGSIGYSVASDADGRYRFDRLPAGNYQLGAQRFTGGPLIMGQIDRPLGRVVVTSDRAARLDLAVEDGVDLQIRVVAGDTIVATTVALIPGTVHAATESELSRSIDGRDDVRQEGPFLVSGSPVAIPVKAVAPGAYSACAARFGARNSAASDQGGAREASGAVRCTSVTVAPTPALQTLSIPAP